MKIRFAKDIVMPWGVMFWFTAFFAAVAGAQFFVRAVIDNNTTRVANVACTMLSIDPESDNHIRMRLNCGGIADSTGDTEFITTYLASTFRHEEPKSFTCTLYESAGKAVCKL